MLRGSRTGKWITVGSLSLALCLSAATSHAVWQWMRGAALTDLQPSDWTLLEETARHVLNDLPDRKQANWSNPDTGNKGSIMALATFQYDGRECRRTAMRNITRRGRDDRAAYTLCREASGAWEFVPESAIRASLESGGAEASAPGDGSGSAPAAGDSEP